VFCRDSGRQRPLQHFTQRGDVILGYPEAQFEDFRKQEWGLVDDFLYVKSLNFRSGVVKRNHEAVDFAFPKRNDYTASNFDGCGDPIDKGPR
jgi:hypothetical protein